MTAYLIALGANISLDRQDPAETLAMALGHLAAFPRLALKRQSRWYRTPAYPPGSGPDFVNAAAMIMSEMPPSEVMTLLHGVEARLGRERRVRWAPRTCDLDLLGAEDIVLPDTATVRHWMDKSDAEAQAEAAGDLILPHPRLHLRAFVLVPLAEVAPDWRHPILNRTAAELCAELPTETRAEVVPL